MKTIDEQISDIDYMLRQLQKMDSKMLAGQVILAWRSGRKLISELEKNKLLLINEATEQKTFTSSLTKTNMGV